MVAAIAMLAMCQSAYESAVTIEKSDILLPAALEAISGQCHIRCSLPRYYASLKVTVLAKNVKAQSLLDRIASTFGLVGKATPDGYVFSAGPELDALVLDKFLQAESNVRRELIQSKLLALALLTQKPIEAYSATEPSGGVKTDADAWARSHITQPGFYALGVAYRYDVLDPSVKHDITNLDNFIIVGDGRPSTPFLVDSPAKYPVDSTFIDEPSASIRGTMIAFGFLPTTAEIRVTVMRGEKVRNDPLLETPFLFAKPPKETAKTQFATILASWQTAPADLPPEMRKIKPTSSDDEPSPGYFDDRMSLTQKLERLHVQTGLPIVSTSLRIPALKPDHEGVVTVGSYLDRLAKDEQCFLRAEDGVLLVRHPAYWLMRISEPPEAAIAHFEEVAAKRPLNLDEYADLALAIGTNPDYGLQHAYNPAFVPHAYDRLLNLRGLLLRFDGGPLATAFPALHFYSQIPHDTRELMLRGLKLGFPVFQPAPYVEHVVECAPIFDAFVGPRYMTPHDLGYGSELLYGFWPERLEHHTERDIRDNYFRAGQFWVVKDSDSSYTFKTGFGDVITSSYTFSIRQKDGS
jgi:hypothetical protein